MWTLPGTMESELEFGLAGDLQIGRWHVLGHSPTVVVVSLAHVRREPGVQPTFDEVLAELAGPLAFACGVQDQPGVTALLAVAADGSTKHHALTWRTARELGGLSRGAATEAIGVTQTILVAWAYQHWPWWQMFLDGTAKAQGKPIPPGPKLYGEGKWMPGQPYITGESEGITVPLGRCPWCEGEVSATANAQNEPTAVAHTLPYCETFANTDVNDYLSRVLALREAARLPAVPE